MKLEKCSYCGNQHFSIMDIARMDNGKLKGLTVFRVVCPHCEAWGPPSMPSNIKDSRTEAITAWNRRYVCDDKNGKAVYAGDRVKVYATGGVSQGVVEWDKEYAQYVINYGPDYCAIVRGHIELIESEAGNG